ncbi:MAG: CehA/McbA family metallohydrolase [Deltaproteobacteria bacterium]|nr:CehA/McbA family metallohydrolase [Deltaproteobacteria bacterium]
MAPGDYTLQAFGEGRTDSAVVDVTVGAGSKAAASVAIDPPGFLDFDVTDDTATPLPCRLTVFNGHDANVNTAGAALRHWSADGSGTMRLLPGEYTVAASHGFEYEIEAENVTITAGDTATFDAALERTVDTTGYMTGDFHIHTEFSIDSTVPAVDRIRELAGDGMEMPVITDHDHRSDYTSYAAAQGLTDWIKPVTGSEVSPIYGHTNVWPLTGLSATEPDYYGVGLVEYDEDGKVTHRNQFADIWDIATNVFGAVVHQINHPRDGSGWFDHVGYDPALGVDYVDTSRWSPDFEAIEVWNGGKDSSGTVLDWYSFLDQGFRFTMNGNSDSHTSSKPLGVPRNYFAMPDDDPATADPDDMVDSIVGNRNQVSIGAFINFSIEGEDIGGFVTGLDSTDVDLDIRVQAPSWLDVNYVRVISNNGQVIWDDAISTDPSEIVRFDDTVTLSFDDDVWLVVEAGHTSARVGPIDNGEFVWAMTNPIWVDIDGNGDFDPPGLPPIAAGTYAMPKRVPSAPEIPRWSQPWP